MQTMTRTLRVVVCLLGILLLPAVVCGDELTDVKAQIEQLRRENETLRQQVDKQGEVTERLLQKITTLETRGNMLPQAAAEPPRPSSLEGIVVGGASEPGTLGGLPKLTIKGFADFAYSVTRAEHESSNTFGLGWKGEEVDLMLTSALTDHVSFLLENNFSVNTENTPSFKIQRAVLKYALSDLLNIKVGRIHTPLGYWNQTYHHGAWLQTTIFRPEIYRFEAQDGFLPLHAVGIDLSGVKAFEAVDVAYNVDVLNGRGRAFNEVPERLDKNDSKAINFLVSLSPHAVEGLKFGGDLYYDVIPSNPPTANRTTRIEELILGGHAVYINHGAELLAELFNIHHDDKRAIYNTLGYYLQAGYKIDKFTPYYRYDFVDVADSDPFYTARHVDLSEHTIGLRWDLIPWNALKFEYSFANKKQADDEHTFTVNSSITF